MAIRERSPKVWQVRVYAGTDPDTGRRIWDSATVHGGRRAAEKLEREMKTAAATRTATGSDRTLAQAATDVVDHLASIGRAPKTVHEYRRLTEILAADPLGRRALGDITARDVDRYYARLGKTTGRAGKTRGASAIIPHHTWLRNVGNWAVRWDWWPRNVIASATPPRRVGKKRRPAVEDAEILAIFAELDTQRDPSRATAARIEAVLGCRRGELCAIRWADVDLDGKVVHIHAGIDTTPGAPRVKDTKTHQERWVTIDDRAVDLFRRHRTAMRARALTVGGRLGKNPWVFSDDPLCREPLDPDRLTSAWKRAAKKAGHVGVRLQDARRWAGTALLDEGEDITVVADLFGHADPATTRRHYVRATDAGGRRSAAIRGRILDPASEA